MNNDEINQLVESLREEMTQYGELLALMQEQQGLIINRQPQELLLKLQTFLPLQRLNQQLP